MLRKVSEAMAESKIILCVGCGDNISNRTSDRRNLLSDSSKSVVMAWKDIVLKKLRSHGMEDEECSTIIQTLQRQTLL